MMCGGRPHNELAPQTSAMLGSGCLMVEWVRMEAGAGR